MSTKEIMTKIFSAYKYSLVGVSLFSITLFSAATVQSQTIEEQQPVSDPVSDYMNAIDNVEAEHSAYSTELSDLYLGLGKSLYSKQEYEKARQAFQRGMQIQRVNYGLNSLSQSPYLLSIADTESFLGNWDQSQEALENLYSINQQAYGANDVRMLPVLDQMLDWYLDSYDERTPRGGYANLVISERIATRMYSILENELPLDDPQAPERFRRIGYLQYFIANHIKQHGEPSESGVTFSTGGSTSCLAASSRAVIVASTRSLIAIASSSALRAASFASSSSRVAFADARASSSTLLRNVSTIDFNASVSSIAFAYASINAVSDIRTLSSAASCASVVIILCRVSALLLSSSSIRVVFALAISSALLRISRTRRRTSASSLDDDEADDISDSIIARVAVTTRTRRRYSCDIIIIIIDPRSLSLRARHRARHHRRPPVDADDERTAIAADVVEPAIAPRVARNTDGRTRARRSDHDEVALEI